MRLVDEHPDALVALGERHNPEVLMFVLSVALSSAVAGEPLIADRAQVEAALLAVSSDPEIGDIISDLLLHQIASVAPVTLTDGVWVVPVTTGALLEDRTVAGAVERELAADGLLLPGDFDFDLGLAYVPQDVVRDFNLDYDFGHYTDLAEDVLASQATDAWWWVVGGGIILGGIIIDYVVDVTVTQPVKEVASLNRELGYWQGREDFRDMNDPTKDSDGDGKNNQDDPDDDNDGTDDKYDAYPFDDNRQICDLCGRTAIVGLGDMTDTIFASDIEGSLDLTEIVLGSITSVVASGDRAVFAIYPR